MTRQLTIQLFTTIYCLLLFIYYYSLTRQKSISSNYAGHILQHLKGDCLFQIKLISFETQNVKLAFRLASRNHTNYIFKIFFHVTHKPKNYLGNI